LQVLESQVIPVLAVGYRLSRLALAAYSLSLSDNLPAVYYFAEQIKSYLIWYKL
jgi:hypothetical protein